MEILLGVCNGKQYLPLYSNKLKLIFFFFKMCLCHIDFPLFFLFDILVFCWGFCESCDGLDYDFQLILLENMQWDLVCDREHNKSKIKFEKEIRNIYVMNTFRFPCKDHVICLSVLYNIHENNRNTLEVHIIQLIYCYIVYLTEYK